MVTPEQVRESQKEMKEIIRKAEAFIDECLLEADIDRLGEKNAGIFIFCIDIYHAAGAVAREESSLRKAIKKIYQEYWDVTYKESWHDGSTLTFKPWNPIL